MLLKESKKASGGNISKQISGVSSVTNRVDSQNSSNSSNSEEEHEKNEGDDLKVETYNTEEALINAQGITDIMSPRKN